MTGDEFLQAIQSRSARIAVGASAVRGRGNVGTVPAARNFLRALKLAPFGVSNRAAFARELDRATDALRMALPSKARHWGLARKLLNIFLRDCLYTSYIDTAYNMQRAQALLELPLDSITAKELRRSVGGGRLPAWPGVKHLTPEISALFQQVATREAQRRGIARVHLDAVWWSVSRDGDAN